MAKALNQLQNSLWGEIVLVTVGVGLVIYGIFAILNVHFKGFPTKAYAAPTTPLAASSYMPFSLESYQVTIEDIVKYTTN